MKEIDEAIEEMVWVIRHINSDRHPYYKPALAALRLVKWIYSYPHLIGLDTSDIKRKFTSYLKGDNVI